MVAAGRAALEGLGLGGKVFFTNSGAEAVEAALKLARKAKRGGTIVSLHRGFHGRTYGALSATPQEDKQAPFAPLVPGFVAVEPTAESLRAAPSTPDTAAVILEPIQGESGVWVLGDDVLRAAREACDEHGALLIFDEIQCGLGRSGRLWAHEWSGVTPDLMTVAKALGGGLPIGAIITTPALGRRLPARRPRHDVRRRPDPDRGRPRRRRPRSAIPSCWRRVQRLGERALRAARRAPGSASRSVAAG